MLYKLPPSKIGYPIYKSFQMTDKYLWYPLTSDVPFKMVGVSCLD
jgi:hypothetical protein